MPPLESELIVKRTITAGHIPTLFAATSSSAAKYGPKHPRYKRVTRSKVCAALYERLKRLVTIKNNARRNRCRFPGRSRGTHGLISSR